jgi:hypothetical protein
MLFQEVTAIESNAQELGTGHPLAKIGNHRILYDRISQVSSRIGGQKSDSRAWLHPFLAILSCAFCSLCDSLHELSTCTDLPEVTSWHSSVSDAPEMGCGLCSLGLTGTCIASESRVPPSCRNNTHGQAMQSCSAWIFRRRYRTLSIPLFAVGSSSARGSVRCNASKGAAKKTECKNIQLNSYR